MNLVCLFGHKWNGCKCGRCGAKRDKQHDWDLCEGKCRRCGAPCEVRHDWGGYGTKCSRCGQMRLCPFGQHNMQILPSKCDDVQFCYKKRCSVCGLELHDSLHKWQAVPGKCNIEKCSVCGKEHKAYNHEWQAVPNTCNERCSVCGEERKTNNHKWQIVPNECKERCSICGEEQAKHNWGEVVRSEQSDMWGRFCKDCGKWDT